MTNIKTLPFLQDAKVIVVDEDCDSKYALTLVASWVKDLQKYDNNSQFELLSFSDPKPWYRSTNDIFASDPNKLIVHDHYTVDVDNVDVEGGLDLRRIYRNIKPDTKIIINCLSSLVLFAGLSKSVRFIHSLSAKAAQIICLYKRDFIRPRVPRIETLGTTYVKIDRYPGVNTSNDIMYNVTWVHRKVGGSILSDTENVTQSITDYNICQEKVAYRDPKTEVHQKPNKTVPSSFRIEINEREKAQREETSLPYTAVTNNSGSARIHYIPDIADDIDDEDPDDDLCL